MMRLFVFARHAESAANTAHVMSSDPKHDAGLTPRGEIQASILGDQLAWLDLDGAVCSRFLRTRQTLEIALRDRGIPIRVEPDLDEIDAGVFDGVAIARYWWWKERHRSNEALPGGESLDQALRRYAVALRRLLDSEHQVTLIVCHELALRSLVDSSAEVAQATPYLVDEQGLLVAVGRLETLVSRREREPRLGKAAA